MKNIDVISTNKINFNNLLVDLISCFNHKDSSIIPSSFRELIESILIAPIWIDIELFETDRIPFLNILVDNELILIVDENDEAYKLRSTQKLESMKVKLTSEFEKAMVTFVPFKESIEFYCELNHINLFDFKTLIIKYIDDDVCEYDFENYVNYFNFTLDDFKFKNKNDRWVILFEEWLRKNG